MSATVATSERRIITSAVATLIYQDQSYLENGFVFDDLVRVAASQESECTKKQLENIINKELLSGILVKLPNGTFALGPPDHDGDSCVNSEFEYNDSNTKMTSSSDSLGRSSPQRTRGRPKKCGESSSTSMQSSMIQNARVRVGERPKMAKKLFDPSDNNVPCKRKRGRPIGSLNKSTIKMIAGNDKEDTLSESQQSLDVSADEIANDETVPHETSRTTQNARVRVGGRPKMTEKIFDPSDNNVPCKRKRGRPIGSLNKSTIKTIAGNDEEDTLSESRQSLDGSADEIENDKTVPRETSGGVCSVCLVQKPLGSNDRLVECRDCNNKAHLSCLQSGASKLKPRPDNTWQCQQCKTCVVCCETNDAGILTVCSICSDAYHALCHSPRIPERKWECKNCLESRPTVEGSPDIHLNYKDYGTKASLEDQFLKPHELDRVQTKLSKEASIDPNIPDISNWNVDNVYDYFFEHFPQTAQILREQEFDGQALSMACRADIVRGLGLPLGTALALYRIVVKLQTRKDDWKMCWG